MRLWIKLLAGCVFGSVLAYLAPIENYLPALDFAADVVLHIGRYVLFPLLFFSLAIGTHELRSDKKTLRLYSRGIFYVLIFTALTVIIGMLSAIVFVPNRIPILIEQEMDFTISSATALFLRIIPKNAFQIFTGDPNFLLPILFLAFLLGLNFSFDRLATRPAVQFFDSMSRIFYHINNFVLELMGIGLIVISAYLVVQLKTVPELTLFRQLLILFGIDVCVLVFGLFPLALYFFGGKENPYKWLYALIGPALIGFFTGDGIFALTGLIRYSKENLGIPRKAGVSLLPLFSIICRAGTAMVTAVSFFIILRSYSSLGLTIGGILWIMASALIVSIVTGTVPGAGPLMSLSILCTLYGNGIEEGYLILKPIVPLLISFGIVVDVLTSAVCLLLASRHEGLYEEIEVKEYI